VLLLLLKHDDSVARAARVVGDRRTRAQGIVTPPSSNTRSTNTICSNVAFAVVMLPLICRPSTITKNNNNHNNHRNAYARQKQAMSDAVRALEAHSASSGASLDAQLAPVRQTSSGAGCREVKDGMIDGGRRR
jgi:hypothetical protein